MVFEIVYTWLYVLGFLGSGNWAQVTYKKGIGWLMEQGGIEG